MIVLKILMVAAIVFVVLFLLSLVIYFFNLDMKMAAKMIGPLTKHYDRSKAKRDARKEKEKQMNKNS